MTESLPGPPDGPLPDRQDRVRHVLNWLRQRPEQGPDGVADGLPEADRAALRALLTSLRDERVAQGLSLPGAAESARISCDTLTGLEAGEDLVPSLPALCRLARALGKELVLSLRDLPGGEEKAG